MQILVTGAAGFLGHRLITALLERPDIDKIIAFDRIAAQFADRRVASVTGDIADPAALQANLGPEISGIFHLAAVVSGEAEQDFDLGMRVNVDATRALFERVRAVGTSPKLVMTSSVAVFGGDLPDVVPDTHVWQPQSSYGTEKAINDLLLADYSRRGWIDGRSLRMPTIVVRPGKPNRAASSFASGIVREPVNGQDAVCPVAPETVLWLMSPDQAIRNLLHGFDLPASALATRRVINMPGLSVTVGEMLNSLRRVCGDAVADRVRMQRDGAIEAIVNSWPGNFTADAAKRLGFTADTAFDAIVEAFVRENARTSQAK